MFSPQNSASHQNSTSAIQTRGRANSSDKAPEKMEQMYRGGGPPNRGKLDWNTKSTFKVHVISLALASTEEIKDAKSPVPDGKDKQTAGIGTPPQSSIGKPRALTAKRVATLTFEAVNQASFRSGTMLTDIRAKILEAYLTSPFVFCSEEGYLAPEQDDLNTYLSKLKASPSLEDTEFTVYVTVSKENPSIAKSILSQPPFYLKFIRVLEQSGQFSVEGSLDSSVFKGQSPAALPMNDLRAFVKSMSVDEKQDIFCLKDGTPIQGHVTLSQYLTTASPRFNPAERVPSIPICFKKAGQNVPKSAQEAGFFSMIGAADPSVMEGLKHDMSFTDRSAREVHRDKTSLDIRGTLDAREYAARSDTVSTHTSKMNENDWDSVLKNSNALYGWKFDFKQNKIVRAPHPAFKLRRGLNLEPVKKKASVPSQANEVPEEDNENEKLKKEYTPLSLDDMTKYTHAKPCGIPSYMINDRSKIDIASISHEFQQSMAENHFTSSSFEIGGGASFGGVSVGASVATSQENENTKSLSEKKYSKTLVASYRIPRVTIRFPSEDLEPTDDLREAIELVRTTKNLQDLRKLHALFGHLFCQEVLLGGCLQTSKVLSGKEIADESMSRSNFKASVGLNVTVPGGPKASTKGSREKQDQKEQGKKMTDTTENLAFDATGGNTILAANPPAWLESVADFNYWRVIEQSQLTPLSDVISGISKYEDIKMWFLQAIPKLQEYLVIPQSRTLDVRFRLNFDSEGLSRALPKGSADEASPAEEDISKVVAEADRWQLDTYLGHNPTKPPHAVRTNIDIREKEEIPKSAFTKDGGRMVMDMTRYTYQVKTTTMDAIFSPASTQAPVLMIPKNISKIASPLHPNPDPPGIDEAVDGGFKPGGFTAGGFMQIPANDASPGVVPIPDTLPVPASTQKPQLQSIPQHKYTVWRLEVPYGYSLAHNSLISIKSLATTIDPTPLTPTCYRNGQGVFLPTITNNSDPCYWRILKAAGGNQGDSIRDGEAIRLAWHFSDQSSGYRDYKDDFYGRRRFNRPSEMAKDDALYLKVPFPRFEDIGSTEEGTSMLMNGSALRKPIVEKLKLLDHTKQGGTVDVNYNLFDLSFRLDYVGLNGNGEIGDYMNVQWGEHTVLTDQKLLYTTRDIGNGQKVLGKVGGILGETILGPTFGGVLGENVGEVAGKFVDNVERRFDGMTNAIRDRSPVDIALSIVNFSSSINPIGALCSMFF